MTHSPTRRRTLCAPLVALLIALTACGSDSSETDTTTTTEEKVTTTTAAATELEGPGKDDAKPSPTVPAADLPDFDDDQTGVGQTGTGAAPGDDEELSSSSPGYAPAFRFVNQGKADEVGLWIYVDRTPSAPWTYSHVFGCVSLKQKPTSTKYATFGILVSKNGGFTTHSIPNGSIGVAAKDFQEFKTSDGKLTVYDACFELPGTVEPKKLVPADKYSDDLQVFFNYHETGFSNRVGY